MFCIVRVRNGALAEQAAPSPLILIDILHVPRSNPNQTQAVSALIGRGCNRSVVCPLQYWNLGSVDSASCMLYSPQLNCINVAGLGAQCS